MPITFTCLGLCFGTLLFAQVDTDGDLNADITDPFPGDPLQGGVYVGGTITYDVLMTGDLDATGFTGTVIIIAADGVTFDGNGHQIIAPDTGTVMLVNNQVNVTIVNVNSPGTGSGSGLELLSSSGNTVTGSDFSSHRFPISINGGGSNTIDGNNCSNGGTGINVTGSAGNLILNNLITNCLSRGIGISSSSGSQIFHNNIFSNNLNLFSDQPIELSFNGEGNFWGHDCSAPALFVGGVDSNDPNVIDSNPYGIQDGWLNPQVTPGCPPIKNTAPIIVSISAPIDPVEVNTQINASADFTDPDVNDIHTAVWDWGDNTTSSGTVDQVADTVSGSHTYTSAGVYTVTLTVTDSFEESDLDTFQFVVIYDPDAGFVTGGGWIDSPPGAYTPDPLLIGKANFGFVSKYKKGQSIPDGNTQFNFHVADLNFSSTEYEWLVIAGPNAKYKGSGTINNSGNYGFMLTGRDGQANGGGGVDRFRIKIWDKDAGDEVVYDNQLGDADDVDATDAIEGGSIVIHSQGQSKIAVNFDQSDKFGLSSLPEDYALLQNYPNPFNPETEIYFQLPDANHVVVAIFNTRGQEIRRLVDGNYAAGYHSLRWDGMDNRGNPVSSGVYLYQLKTAAFSQVRKMSLMR